MSGSELHTMLLDHGATLHLDPQGKLSIKPMQVAQRYRTAIQQHLCYLLTAAAIAEVSRLMQAHGLEDLSPQSVSTQMLNTAALSGDVSTTRQAAVSYVSGWRETVEG